MTIHNESAVHTGSVVFGLILFVFFSLAFAAVQF
jgi:hypothetical protein